MKTETKREKELREKLELKLFANTNLDSDDIFAVSEVVMDLLKAEGIIGTPPPSLTIKRDELRRGGQ